MGYPRDVLSLFRLHTRRKVNGARELLKLEAIKAARHQEVCIDFCTPRFGKSFAAEPEKSFALEKYSVWIYKLLVRLLEHA